jgi:hypothetical protein
MTLEIFSSEEDMKKKEWLRMLRHREQVRFMSSQHDRKTESL